MRESAEHASRLESAISGTDWVSASRAWGELENSCSACHEPYRNTDASPF
jgi:cytochrome c556